MKTKRFFCMLLALVMVLSVMTAVTAAAAEKKPLSVLVYDEESGQLRQVLCRNYSSYYRLRDVVGDGWYLLDDSIANRITHRVKFTGDVHLILMHGVTVNFEAGIELQEGSSLSIHAQSATETQQMGVFSSGNLPAIGGTDCKSGTVSLYGGVLNLNNGGGTSGIGSGGVLNVYDGTVTAVGGNGAPAIDDATVNVYGGALTATGDNGAPGIGGTEDGEDATVNVYGGALTAIGGNESGIRGDLNFCGGTVIAKTQSAEPDGSAAVNGNVTVAEQDDVRLTDLKTGRPFVKEQGQSWSDVFSGRSEIAFRFDPIAENVTYLTYDQNRKCMVEQTCEHPQELKEDMTTLTNGWYYVSGHRTIDHVVDIKGDVSLILMDHSSLTVNGGLLVVGSNLLNIYAQSDDLNRGRLVTNGGVTVAGIGGSNNVPFGGVNLYGGTVIANGGKYAAGIGGGNVGYNGFVNIYGGEVFATGGGDAAGIGSGYTGGGCLVTVHGGKVTAIGSGAPGIGGGGFGNARISLTCSHLLFYGGEVTAVGDQRRGMSADTVEVFGDFSFTDDTTGQPIQKSDGQSWADALTSTAVSCAAVPNVPYLAYENGTRMTKSLTEEPDSLWSGTTTWDQQWYEASGTVTIDDIAKVSGNVNLLLKDGCNLTVTKGINVPLNSSLTIYAQSEGENMGILNAGSGINSSNNGAGIGGGVGNGNGTVIIHGGKITAKGANGAGIGGGNNGNGGIITIYGGDVTAIGAINAAGIGGSGMRRNDAGTVTICGGTVTAQGAEFGAGIGGCDNSDGTVTISGGYVNATGGEYAPGLQDGAVINGGVVIANGTELYHYHSFTSGIYKDNGDGTHSQKCSCCDEYGNTEEHSFTSDICKDNGNGTHSRKCSCCDAYDDAEEQHSFTSGIYKDIGGGTHAQKCSGCEAFGDPQPHAAIDFCHSNNTASHSQIYCCYCLDYIGVQAHLFEFSIDNGDGTHSKTCPNCYEQVTEEHDFVWVDNGDGTHTQQCRYCKVKGTATAEHTMKDGVCTECASPLKRILVGDGTVITYDPAQFEITDRGVLKRYFGSDPILTIPDGVREVADNALAQSEITKIIVPASLRVIGDSAFKDCAKLETVLFQSGSQLTTIKSNAFASCPALSAIYLARTQQKISTLASGCSDDTYNNCTLYVPLGTKSLYAAQADWKNFKKIVEISYVLNMGSFEERKTDLKENRYVAASGENFDYYAMRFLFMLDVGENVEQFGLENYGTYTVPWDLFRDGELVPASARKAVYDVKTHPVTKNNTTFSTDLLGIPAGAKDRNIYVLPFVNGIAYPEAAYSEQIGGERQVWTSTNSLPAKYGSYILQNDVTLSAAWNIPAGVAITLDLNGHTIDRGLNAATVNGFVISTSGRLTILDSSEQKTGTITGGNNLGNGGGILVNGGVLSLKEITVSGNEASLGGGINVNDGSVVLDNSTVSDNRATNGGGINANGGAITLNNSTVSGNRATSGGGVYIGENAMMTANICHIDNNTATDNAAGIYNQGGLAVNGGILNGNCAAGNSGGFYANSGTASFRNCEIKNNCSDHLGGAFLMEGNASVSLNGCSVSGNSAANGGGAFETASNDSRLILADTAVTGNSVNAISDGIKKGGGPLPLQRKCCATGRCDHQRQHLRGNRRQHLPGRQ